MFCDYGNGNGKGGIIFRVVVKENLVGFGNGI